MARCRGVVFLSGPKLNGVLRIAFGHNYAYHKVHTMDVTITLKVCGSIGCLASIISEDIVYTQLYIEDDNKRHI